MHEFLEKNTSKYLSYLVFMYKSELLLFSYLPDKQTD